MKIPRSVRFLIGLAIVGVLAYLFRGYLDQLHRLPQVSPWIALAIFVLYFLMRALNGLTMKLALDVLGYRVSHGESTMLAILTTYANLLLPRAGLGLPAIYLKLRRGVNYADFTSQALIVTTLQIGCIGVLGLLFQAWITLQQGVRFDPIVCGLFAFSMLAGIGTPLMRTSLFAGMNGKVAAFIHRIADAWGKIGSARKTVVSILLWNIPVMILRAWRLQLAFYAIGAHVSFTGVFIASLLADLLFFVSITPAGLGFREAAITYSAAMMGTDPGVALSASVLDRIIWTVGVVIVAQIGMWRMIRPALRSSEQPPAEAKAASSLEGQ